eukprot:CAMPEP_0182484488 /NCGR_PEP_ID=MMETSP1319-20130603/43528_1 /TAXON_ID=172717 /ORGANISM="Bolidomonas pacifica, Strain RCC208" /LENGTH=558 /DNA_ID=CAMNT_0024686395 /DNA_START=38 /DNA_END=1711 /DNA_ORIENTATION=-
MTALLLRVDQSHAEQFGEGAIRNRKDDAFVDCALCENFKMRLFLDEDDVSRPVSRDDQRLSHREHQFEAIGQSGPESVPLFSIFVAALKYLRRAALEVPEIQACGDNITWVITIPAIWALPAKRFMRHAAEEANIGTSQSPDGDQSVLLCYEPEAASVHCFSDDSILGNMQAGVSILVVDCGGGTVDVTGHEIKSVDPLRLDSLVPHSGGPWGGSFIDAAFERCLLDLLQIFDAADREAFRYSDERLIIVSKWLEDKESFTGSQTVKVDVSGVNAWLVARGKTPPVLDEYIEVYNTERLAADASMHISKQGATRLKLPPALVMSFFDLVLNPIVAHVRDVLTENADVFDPCGGHPGLTTIFLVGGLSRSEILQQRMVEHFTIEPSGTHPGRVVTRAADPVMAVAFGACRVGMDPNTVVSRVSSRSYGIEGAMRKKNRIPAHNSDLAHIEVLGDRGPMVMNAFKMFINQGDVVDGQFEKIIPCCPQDEEHEHVTLRFYSAPHANPKLVNEPGCELLGTASVRFDMRIPDWRKRKVSVAIVPQGDQLVIQAFHDETDRRA